MLRLVVTDLLEVRDVQMRSKSSGPMIPNLTLVPTSGGRFLALTWVLAPMSIVDSVAVKVTGRLTWIWTSSMKTLSVVSTVAVDGPPGARP